MTLFKIDKEFAYQFLAYLAEHEINKSNYNNIQHQNAKINIYNNLVGLVLAKATKESNKGEYEKLMAEVKKYLNLSERVRMTVDKSIVLNRAFLHYYAGETTKALNLVSKIYE